MKRARKFWISDRRYNNQMEHTTTERRLLERVTRSTPKNQNRPTRRHHCSSSSSSSSERSDYPNCHNPPSPDTTLLLRASIHISHERRGGRRHTGQRGGQHHRGRAEPLRLLRWHLLGRPVLPGRVPTTASALTSAHLSLSLSLTSAAALPPHSLLANRREPSPPWRRQSSGKYLDCCPSSRTERPRLLACAARPQRSSTLGRLTPWVSRGEPKSL